MSLEMEAIQLNNISTLLSEQVANLSNEIKSKQENFNDDWHYFCC